MLEETVEDDDEEIKVTAKADEKEIMNIVTKYFGDFNAKMNEKISIEIEDSKKYLYAIEEEIRHEVAQIEGRI